MAETLSATESAVLSVFRQMGARAGALMPDDVLRSNVLYGGGPSAQGDLETAILNLQFRGFITPGPDPASAISWVLTQSGEAVLKAPHGNR
jgi:hypothetical protein